MSEFFLLINSEALCISAVHVFLCVQVLITHTCIHKSLTSKTTFVREFVYYT